MTQASGVRRVTWTLDKIRQVTRVISITSDSAKVATGTDRKQIVTVTVTV